MIMSGCGPGTGRMARRLPRGAGYRSMQPRFGGALARSLANVEEPTWKGPAQERVGPMWERARLPTSADLNRLLT